MTTRILVTGASGQLGGYLLRALERQQESVVAWSGSHPTSLFGCPVTPVDLTDRDGTARAFAEARPDLVIHAAALSRIDLCYRDPSLAVTVNARGTEHLAELAATAGARLVYVSTDLVFDGEQGPYRETDAAQPVSVYGTTKRAGESAALTHDRAAAVRVSLLFGPTVVARPVFFDKQVEALRTGERCKLFADEWRTPLSLQTAAQSLIAVARSDVSGLLHLGGPERMTRLEMGQRLARAFGKNPDIFVASLQADVPAPEPRPRDVSLNSARFRELFPQQPWPPFEAALAELGMGTR
ncbi:MAG: NAD(P)-dependent oxidoreductase [Pirellulaceae bacterium]